MSGKIFSAVVRTDRWLKARFTPTGRLLLASLVAVGLFALNPRATLAYQLAMLLLAVLVGAMLWAPAFRPLFSARRRLPKFATVGVPLAYTLEIENRRARNAFDLEVVDEPVRFAGAEAVRAARAQDLAHGARRRRRRSVSYMNYLRSLRALEGVRCEAAAIEQLAPRAVTAVPMRVTPTRRGWMRLSKLRLMRTDPLGVFRAAARLDLVDQVLVLPQRYRVSWHGRGASARQVRQGMSRSRISGSGADFARLREYRPRDPLRHIHWRAWARLGEPVVKEFHEESPSRNALVLDVCAPPTVADSTFEEAVSVAASFVTESSWCSGQLDLLIAGDRNVRLSRDGEGAVRMLEVLACVHASRDLDFASLADGLVRHLGGFSTCVLVLLELDDARLKLVRELQLANVHALVLLVSDKAGEDYAPAMRALPDPSLLHLVHPQRAAQALAALSPGVGAAHA